MKGGHWKDGLRDRLVSTKHERSPHFEDLLEDYISDGSYPIAMLIEECIKHHEPILGEIFAHEGGLKVLSLRGPITEKGWQTIRNAMGENSPLEVLRLSDMEFDATTGKQFLDILGYMPALEELTLNGVGVEDTFYSDFYNPVEALVGQASSVKTLNACMGGKGAPNSVPVLLKIFECSTLDRLSFEDAGGVSSKQHASLGEAIMNQFDLKSMRLVHFSSGNLQSYMPFLCKESRLRALALEGCTLKTSEWNTLLAGLSKGKRDLQILSIRRCSKENDGLGIEMSHLASMRNLVSLDLSQNSLDTSTVVSLFDLIEKENMGLLHLHLSCNAVDKETIEALAKLVKGNKILREIEVNSRNDLDDEILEPLALAMKRNTSLEKVYVQRTFGPWWKSMNASLARNRIGVSLPDGVLAGIHLALRKLGLGGNFDEYFIQNAGFSLKDELTLSSLTKDTWEKRHKPVLEEDPSK
jgi:hypothetical protein